MRLPPLFQLSRRDLALALGAAGLAGPALAQGAAIPAVSEAIRRHIQAGEAPGAVVLVARDGRVVHLEAQGLAEAGGPPLRTETVFWVASMTKPVVAVSALMLVEQGRVGLDDPVSKYIPEFARPGRVRTLKAGSSLPPPGPPQPGARPPEYDYAPLARPLTVRDFLTMTSGLQTIGIPNEAIPPITMQDDLAGWVAKLAEAPLEFQPGSQWHYSNATGFEVVARIVEVASGEGYRRFTQSRIFDPLEMRDTSFGRRADLAARTQPIAGPLAQNPIMFDRFTSGSAGLFTTASDYNNFAQMLLNRGEFRGRRLLKPETVAAMASNQIGAIPFKGVNSSDYSARDNRTNPGLKYGFGVAVVTDGPASGLALPTGSFGWDGVGTRRFWVAPAARTVIVMLVPGGQANALHRDVERAVLA